MNDFLKFKKSEALFFGGVVMTIFLISFFQMRTSQMRTRDAQRKADVELVERGLEAYFEEQGLYPPAHNGEIVSCGRAALEPCAWGEGRLIDSFDTEYLSRLPRDPLFEKGYRYIYSTNEKRTAFRIQIALELKGDKDLRKNLTTMCAPNVECTWYVEK